MEAERACHAVAGSCWSPTAPDNVVTLEPSLSPQQSGESAGLLAPPTQPTQHKASEPDLLEVAGYCIVGSSLMLAFGFNFGQLRPTLGERHPNESTLAKV